MKPRTIKYYFKEALKSMKRNGLMTLASISTVALSLFMLGVFLCGVINLNNMASSLENQVQLSIYLKDGLTNSHRQLQPSPKNFYISNLSGKEITLFLP